MNSITLTIPAISPELIASIETETITVHENEELAIAALREKYSQLARQNGFVKIAWFARQTSNYNVEREEFHRDAQGHKTRGLLIIDNFDREHDDQNRGTLVGTRLYLTPAGWLCLKRHGVWSRWQGEPEWWHAGASATPDSDNFDPSLGDDGENEILDDARVAERYALADIVAGLGKALAAMATKLPERLSRLRQRADLAAKILVCMVDEDGRRGW